MPTTHESQPDLSPYLPITEWECVNCGALLELPSDDQAPRLCDECAEESEE